ncbi:hypothetical protein PRIPAC_87896 [Pristionchus pacificus]|uniref:Uncharacterized protein n=1 Tax=Pristionchus pacificus TaxID=54126 RepID=A0A2A6CWE3_PRIPA|nr:hypothetical protein PRIPAC_87896 [Pristionchus pacificus]|eukprot:PDM82479.1 hypothetical protein PRIPAC_36872 [Pristionchus pacificus]
MQFSYSFFIVLLLVPISALSVVYDKNCIVIDMYGKRPCNTPSKEATDAEFERKLDELREFRDKQTEATRRSFEITFKSEITNDGSYPTTDHCRKRMNELKKQVDELVKQCV